MKFDWFLFCGCCPGMSASKTSRRLRQRKCSEFDQSVNEDLLASVPDFERRVPLFRSEKVHILMRNSHGGRLPDLDELYRI